MLYIYPDNYIVPVIFVENLINKKSDEICRNYYDEQMHNIGEIKERLKQDQQEKFRNNCEEKYYDRLQEKLIMDWEQEGESPQEIKYMNILDEIDKEYVYSETEKI